MAEYLGIDMDTETGLLDVARMAVAAPIPPGWQQLDNDDGFAVFRFAQLAHNARAFGQLQVCCVQLWSACIQCMSLLSAVYS